MLLRRLRELPRCRDEDRRSDLQDQAATVGGTSVKIHHDGSSMSTSSSTSLNSSIQSGSQAASPGGADLGRAAAAGGDACAAKLALASPSIASGTASAAAVGGEACAAEAWPSSSTASGSEHAAAMREGSPKEMISNPWNKFQHEMRGKGFSKATMAKLYKHSKSKTKMP